jgi:hypothetical protein
VVPLQPIAQGQPVDASAYDLTVDGQAGGRVLFNRGQAIRNAQGQNVIIVGMQVDNKSSNRVYHLPADQIYLANVGGQPVKLVQIDNQPVPTSIDVKPCETKNFDLTFMPATPYQKRDLDHVQVQWTLLIDGASEPVVRSTPFAALNRATAIASRDRWAAQGSAGYPHYDLPATTMFRTIEMSEDFRLQQDRTNSFQGQASRPVFRRAQEGPVR